METEATRALIETYYEKLATGKPDEIVPLLADDCEWVPPETAPLGPMTGGRAIADALGARIVRDTFDLSKPFALEVRRTVVDGDVAVVQQRLTATAEATGRAYDNQYCWVYTCADGKIADMEEYADTLLASRVMGWT